MARWADEVSLRGALPYTLRNAGLSWIKTVETFSVTVMLGNNTKSYRAFALFGEGHNLIADPVVPSMSDFLVGTQYSLHPTLLLRSAAYDSQVARDYLKRSAGCTEYHCGASTDELNRRMKAPLHRTVPEVSLQGPSQPG
jgi:hypothetical protein